MKLVLTSALFMSLVSIALGDDTTPTPTPTSVAIPLYTPPPVTSAGTSTGNYPISTPILTCWTTTITLPPGTSPTPTPSPTPTYLPGYQQEWQQCGGAYYNGPTNCVPWTYCYVWNTWYSQCLAIPESSSSSTSEGPRITSAVVCT